MKSVSVSEAKPGMVLARAITDQQGRTIVNQGAKLTQLYISRLDKWGVTELFVEEAAPDKLPAASRKSALRPVAAAGSMIDERPKASPDGEKFDGPRRPPGVYRGADLADRVAAAFLRTAEDPMMAALHEVVRKRLLGQGPG